MFYGMEIGFKVKKIIHLHINIPFNRNRVYRSCLKFNVCRSENASVNFWQTHN